jgi:hypothetical protein
MFRKPNVKRTFENFHLQNVLFLHFYCFRTLALERWFEKPKNRLFEKIRLSGHVRVK